MGFEPLGQELDTFVVEHVFLPPKMPQKAMPNAYRESMIRPASLHLKISSHGLPKACGMVWQSGINHRDHILLKRKLACERHYNRFSVQISSFW